MKKKVSFKNLKILSDESSEIEPIRLSVKEIDKKNTFSNKAELIARIMIEKIIINVFSQIKSKELDSLLSAYCSNFMFKEIDSLLSNNYPCYEKEDYFLSDGLFLNNYLRGESPWDECNITQPTPGAIDRWKIHRTKIIDYTNRNKNQISEADETQSVIYDKQSKKLIKFQKISKLAKKIKEDREKEVEKEKEEEKKKEEEEEISKIKKLGLRIMDSFPSYPLSDDLFKIDINITKEQEKQIEEYREELLLKEEIKKKENEKKAKIEKMKMRAQLKSKENENEEKKNKSKFRGKSIGVTSSGEIIYIQNVNINNLKSEFLEINTKTKNYRKMSILNLNKNLNSLVQKGLSSYNKSKDKTPEIEKNRVDDPNLDFYRINNKDRMNQQIITGGSPFKNFIPEIGVNLKEKGSVKSGGTDFLHKYKKISLEQFEKTLEMFRKSNLANNEIIEIKYDSPNKNDKKENANNNINNNNKSNLLKSAINNNSSINNNNLNYNYNYISQKSLIKSSSLPELNVLNSRTNLESSNIFNSINNNLNININNDSNIKNPFNYTNYNNSNSNFFNSTKYNNMNNFIKTSSSFKNLFYRDDNPYHKEDNFNPNYTTKQFFKKFNPKKNVASVYKKETDNLSKIQDFNTDILKNNNWGSVTNSHSRNYPRGKPFIHSVKKNIFTKTLNNMFRVRSNVNEVYLGKMRVFDKISLRSQSTENKGGVQKIVFDKK